MKSEWRKFGKALIFAVLLATMAFVSVGCASAATIYVPDNYAKIQWAVDNASVGDTIIVKDGTYTENVNVNKRLTIKSENGFANCIVQAAIRGGFVLYVTADYVNISGFTVKGNDYFNSAIYLSADYCNISNNVASNNYRGIYLNCSSNNELISNIVNSNNLIGIDLDYSSNNNISGNSISNNHFGISLYYSSNNNISGNSISNNDDGIHLSHSSNTTTISGNSITNNDFGIYLGSSSNNNSISGNTFFNDGLYVGNSYQNTVYNNTVNGKPLVYLEEKSDTFIDDDAGQVILVSCSNITIQNQELSNTTVGVELWDTDSCLISGNSISNNYYGICLRSSDSNNTISGNSISNNDFVGIYLFSSGNNNLISGNSIFANNYYGIALRSSNNNSISGNNIFSNKDIGIMMKSYSNNNYISSNNISNNNDGIHLYYDSNNNGISSNNISNNNDGICLRSSNNNDILGNNISNNNDGIDLDYSSNNNISGNSIFSNKDVGITFHHHHYSNKIYLNNFINNSDNVYSYVVRLTDIWNSPEEITYTYNGSEFENYLGNYWDDYIFAGNDTNEDGIGDTPYIIPNDNNDNYPLMEPWENYFPEENQPPTAFFTCSPQNPVVNQIITFNASNSTDPDGFITNYEWNFGDGASGTGKVAFHSYSSVRTCTVNLTVTDNKGTTDTTSDTITVSTLQPTSIKVFPSSVSLNVGETQQFTATAYDQNNNPITADFSWTSSNTTVGTINSTGFFTANAAGTTTVKAENGTVYGTASVSVTMLNLNFNINLEKTHYNIGENADVELTLRDGNGKGISGLTEVEYKFDLPSNIPIFNQRDYDQTLGNCTGCTIKNEGCAVTSMAMVLKYFGINVAVPAEHSSTCQQRTGMEPEILDDWLLWKEGYAYNSHDCPGYCLMKWTVLPPGVTASARQYNTYTTGISPQTYAYIDNALSNDKPVIAGVHWTGKPEDSHFVVITGRNGNTYDIIDPYGGITTTLDNGAHGSYVIDHYRSFASTSWKQKSVVMTASGTYKFSAQFPSTPGYHTISVRTNIGGDIIQDTESFFLKYASKKVPVVLVHDYSQDPSSLSILKERLENDGFDVYLIDYSPGEPNCDAMGDIKGYAKKLGEEIEKIKDDTGADKVDIIGHGMGGLVARWYVEDPIEELGKNTNVRKLILLGTPNRGLAIFDFAAISELVGIPAEIIEGYITIYYGTKEKCWEGVWILKYPSLGKAMEQMHPNHGFISRLELEELSPNVHYTSIAGTKAGGLLTLLGMADNDGMVYVIDTKLDKLSSADKEEFWVDHKGLIEDEEVCAKIKERLQAKITESLETKTKEGLQDNPVFENDAYGQKFAQLQRLTTIYGTAENTTKSHNLTLSFANDSSILLMWDKNNSDLDLVLTTPNGTRVNSSAIIDGMNITYHPSIVNFTFEGYEIKNAISGNWTVDIIPVNVSGNVNYTLLTSLDTNLTLSVFPNKYSYYPGEQINLTANLTYFDVPVANFSMTLKISRPDGKVENITLNKINESYSGAYNNTNITGWYGIIATANGTLTETEFIRQTTTSLWVEQPPDLTVKNISFSNDAPFIGDNVTINATIENIGEGNATNAMIEFYVDNPVNGTLTENETINITSNSSKVVSMDWIAEYGTHKIYAVIPASNPFLEENYTNNIALNSINVTGPVINLSLTMPVEVNLKDTFVVEALVENTGTELIGANATIMLPSGLSTTEHLTIALGNISRNKTANWTITANQTGLHEICINFTSENSHVYTCRKNISVVHIELSDLPTNLTCYQDGNLTMDIRITNFNPNVSYVGLHINTSVRDPLDNIYSLINNISLLHAGDTETLEIFWNQTEKSGVYGVNVSLFMGSVLIDNKKTQFEVTLQGDFFDTDTPLNPYPSIMGNHTGTIKPNHTVIATKLYTYPCKGTGGHTEYAEIRNATWNATATWEGYAGDWHNITFDKTVVLLANEEYNYIIRTGSYPQIHHTDALLTENGWINCTEFTDVNGRDYYDRIPAFRLFLW